MKKWLCILAVFALLSTFGCAQSGAPEESGSAAAVSSAAAEGPAASSAGASAESSAEKSAPLDLSALLTDIGGAAPGSAGCSLRQAKAAGELLDWAQDGNTAKEGEVEAWVESSGISPAVLAYTWSAVLDAADRIRAGEAAGELSDAGYTPVYSGYDPARCAAAERSLSPLFTAALDASGSAAYRQLSPTDYSAITLDRFDGIWIDGSTGEMLVIRGDTCREVVPYLELYGETACAVRVRDRSKLGYCPALEIDTFGKGDFSGALTYYVSGIDDGRFWCSAQTQQFDKLPQEF